MENYQIAQTVRIDLQSNEDAPIVMSKQFDHNLRVIAAQVWDGAQPYALPAGYVARVGVRKSDGKRVLNDCETSADGPTLTVYAVITQQMTAVAGKQRAEIQISGPEGQLRSGSFVLDVVPAEVGEDVIESLDEYKSIDAILAEVRQLKAAADKDAQEAAQSAVAAKASETAAANSQSAAAGSASAAAASETAAQASAGAAADSATAAAGSANAAKSSEDAASQSQTSAAASASAAADSKTAAAGSAAAAKASETAAKASETNAAASQTAAANSAAAAKTSEDNAAASKTAAAGSASAAKSSETAAAQSQTSAADSAVAAKASETAAAQSAADAAESALKAGGVQTVNGVSPDASGNVNVSGSGHTIADDIGNVPQRPVLKFADTAVTDESGQTVIHGLGVKLADRAPAPGVPLHCVLKPVGIAPPVPAEGRADGVTLAADAESGVWRVEAAPKLLTPRKIGNAEFDGSGDVTLGQVGISYTDVNANFSSVPGKGTAKTTVTVNVPAGYTCAGIFFYGPTPADNIAFCANRLNSSNTFCVFAISHWASELKNVNIVLRCLLVPKLI